MRSQLSIKVSGSDPVSSSTKAWIKLTLDPPEETSTITKAQLAEWLDKAYGIVDHCTGENEDDAYTPGDPEDTTEQRLQDALGGDNCYESADILSLTERCSLNHRAGISKKYAVYVHCSADDVRDRYRFTCSSDISPTGPSQAESTVQVIIDFTDAGEVPVYRFSEKKEVENLWLKYPPQWLGDVLIGTRRIDSGNIGVGWSNGRITLSQKVSGRLIVYLPIKYDVWTVSVPGVIIGDKRDYTAEAFAFDESLDSPASVELTDDQENEEEGSDCELCSGIDIALQDDEFTTDPVTGELTGVTSSGGSTCQKRINTETRRSCTGELISTVTRYEDTECPSKQVTEIIYTNQGTPAGEIWTAAEYEDTCCKSPKSAGCLPCKEVISSYNGGAPVLPSEQYWIDRYAPAQVIFNRVGREDGLPCGTRTDKFVPAPGTCCGDVLDLSIDDSSSAETVAPSSSCIVYWEEGRNLVEITVSGQGFWLNPGFTIKSGVVQGDKNVTIYTSGDNCGTGTVTVDDGCSEVEWDIRSTAGQWTERTSLIDWEPLGDEWFFVLLSPASCGLAAEGYETSEIVEGRWKYQNITCSKGGADTWARLANADFAQKERYSGLNILRAKPYLDLSTVGGEGWAYTHTFVVYLWEWTC
jgi:hypothetical protein